MVLVVNTTNHSYHYPNFGKLDDVVNVFMGAPCHIHSHDHPLCSLNDPMDNVPLHKLSDLYHDLGDLEDGAVHHDLDGVGDCDQFHNLDNLQRTLGVFVNDVEDHDPDVSKDVGAAFHTLDVLIHNHILRNLMDGVAHHNLNALRHNIGASIVDAE